MSTLSGSCLCGAIEYSCDQDAAVAGHCQCKDCQKISGTGHISSIGVPKGSLHIKGELRFHQKQADSGNTVTRGFCPQCGCHIYAANSGFSELEFIRAGSLDDTESFTPQLVVYHQSAPSWDNTDAQLPHFDSMPH
ncbi:MAG: GFA family protein [Pseudomonadales bacterium]